MTSPLHTLKSRLPQTNLLGLVLRALSMGGKLLLVVYVVRYLGTASLGVYGLVAATVAIATQVLGLELHIFAGREIVSATVERRASVVASQLRVYAASYAVGAAALAACVGLEVVTVESGLWIGGITVTSHVALEAHRVLINLGRPQAAYAVNTLGQGLWVFPVMIGGLLAPRLRTVDAMFATWIAFGVIASLVGVHLLVREGVLAFGARPDRATIRAGLRVGAAYLISSAAFLLVEHVGRFVLEVHHGAEQVGAFTFHASVARVLRELVFTTVAVVAHPRMTAAARGADPGALETLRRELGRDCLRWSVGLTPLLAGALWLALEVVQDEVLWRELPTFGWLFFATLLVNLSMPAHYTLYALGHDRTLAAVHVAAAVVCGLLQLGLVPSMASTGAALATFAAFATLAIAKEVLARRALRTFTRAMTNGPGTDP